MQKQKSNEYTLRLHNLYIGGLMALILVVLQAFLGLDKPSICVSISVTAFAIALPLLGGVLVLNLVEEKYPYGQSHSISARLMNICFITGAIAAFIGMDAAVWNVLWLAGVAFFVTMIVATIVYGWYVSGLEEKATSK
ncbi:MAG TPA: hypothetical protein VKR06_27180 [Ktedonosporobacter sp.]|nr:hypothetical protein [Ktedonosporobacter sp.]